MWSLLMASIFGRYVHLAWRSRLDFHSDWMFLLASFLMWSYWVWWAWQILRQPDFKHHWEGELDHRKAAQTCVQVVIVAFMIAIIQGLIKAFTWWS
jgi:hypothetical protein